MNRRVAVVLAVPNGTHRPDELARATASSHPEWEIGAVWCGDPQLRPPAGSVAWLDDSSNGSVDEVALVAGDPLVGQWSRAVAAARAVLADGADYIVLLHVGATAVLGSIEALVAGNAPLTLVARTSAELADDGRAPSEIDLAAEGLYSTNVAAFGSRSGPVLEWLASQLTGTLPVSALLARAAQLFAADVCTDPSIGVGRWRWDTNEPVLLDVDGYDSESPWTLDTQSERALRIELLGHPDRQRVMERAAGQLAGRRCEIRLPGGLVVDSTIRKVVAEASTAPPAPWSDAANFRDWLAPRYWRALHEERRDLSAAFPDPDGRSAEEFRPWCRGAFTFDEMPMLLEVPVPERGSLVVADRVRTDGLNLVGYLTHRSGLGDVARRLGEALAQAGVPHSRVSSQRTASPTDTMEPSDDRVEFVNSVCIVTADQFPFLAADFPALFTATERMIGYWFWELEHVPLHMRQSIALVDEIWAGSRFVTEAFGAVSPVPVRHVPIPVAEPQRSSRTRTEFPVLGYAKDRTVFLTVFDHLSVTERKNPVGTIEAFRRAFASDEGAVLVIKTMNGHQRWASHQRVLAAADGRDDIRVWDEDLARPDQMALMAAVDCVVSLHRSEGLGLHLAEAMWLGTPTIATRYSGNLDFMNDDNSLLIDAALVNVEHGEGVYPPSAKWAAPDLDHAADAMRRLVSDKSLPARLSAAGRRTMMDQPSLAETGRLIGQLLLGEG